MDEDEIRRAEERGGVHAAVAELKRRVSALETKLWVAITGLLVALLAPIMEAIKTLGGGK